MKKYLIYLLICVIALACNKNEVQVHTIDLFEPQLSRNGNVTLNWTALNIEEGKIFKVMRAENNGEFQSIKIVYNQQSITLKRSTFTHIDSTFSFACDTVHYKIIVKDNETISSRQVSVRVSRPIKLADNPNRNIASIYKIIPELHYILILEKGGGSKLHIYNYLTNELINTINLTSSFIGIGKYNGKYELYCYDGVSQMKFYDLITSQELGILNIQLNIGTFYPTFFYSDNNGHIYFIYNYAFYTIDRATLGVNKYDLGTDYYEMFYTNDTILCL